MVLCHAPCLCSKSLIHAARTPRSAFTMLFLCSRSILIVTRFFFVMKAFFPMAILLLLCWSEYPSSAITLPKYLNYFTCSNSCASWTVYRLPFISLRDIHITLVFFTHLFSFRNPLWPSLCCPFAPAATFRHLLLLLYHSAHLTDLTM